jgi:ComF family protein
MRAYDRPVCSECRRFLSPGESACPTGHAAPDPAIVYALGSFDGAFGTLAHALKYDGFRELAVLLGMHLADHVAESGATTIVAVPTSPRKRRKRGYGHAEDIAAACARAAGLPCIPDALQFTRTVADQTRLNASERHANLKGALAIRQGLSLDGLHVLIVDDVMTTGATMREAARAVKAAGAGFVIGAVIALNLSMQNRGL